MEQFEQNRRIYSDAVEIQNSCYKFTYSDLHKLFYVAPSEEHALLPLLVRQFEAKFLMEVIALSVEFNPVQF